MTKYFNPKKWTNDNYDKLVIDTEATTAPLSNSDIKKVLDYLFREKLLQMSSDDFSGGKFHCPLTNKWWRLNKAQVCHYIDRAHLGLRWDFDNCLICSEQSNCWDAQVAVEGFRSLHHQKFEEVLGEELVNDLLNRSKTLDITFRNDYIELIKELL
jgi:hypothetical protein